MEAFYSTDGAFTVPFLLVRMPLLLQWKQINDALLRTLEAEREGTSIALEDCHNAGAAPLLDLDGGTEDALTGKV